MPVYSDLYSYALTQLFSVFFRLHSVFGYFAACIHRPQMKMRKTTWETSKRVSIFWKLVCVWRLYFRKFCSFSPIKKYETNAKRYFRFIPADKWTTTIIWEFPMATIQNKTLSKHLALRKFPPIYTHTDTHSHTPSKAKSNTATIYEDSVLWHCVFSRLLPLCLDHALCTAMYPDMDVWVSNPTMSRKVFTHVGLVGLSNEMLIRMLAGTMGIYVYLMVTLISLFPKQSASKLYHWWHQKHFRRVVAYSIPQANCAKCS